MKRGCIRCTSHQGTQSYSALGKHLPLQAAAEAMARALLTEWCTHFKAIIRGAETTALRNVFKVGLNEEELLAMQFRLFYSERTHKSIEIIHKDKKGVETSNHERSTGLLLGSPSNYVSPL